MISFPPLDLPLVLGSSSQFRKQVLHSFGLNFAVLNPAIDESLIRDVDPEFLALAIAKAKAEALIPRVSSPSIIITADQVVLVNKEIREKPKTPDEARRFLISYRTSPAETISAVSVYNTQTGKSAAGIDRAQVHLHNLSDEIIEAIISEGTIFYCAGGFAVEHPLMEPLVERINGERESVMGMPIALTARLLWAVI